MIAELGHYALVLALGLALVQACVPLYGARANDPALMSVGGPTAVAQFGFVALINVDGSPDRAWELGARSVDSPRPQPRVFGFRNVFTTIHS